MLAPIEWIKDYVDIELSPKALGDKMIMTGNGVEGIEELGSNIVNVVVGKIEKITKHPDAEKLVVCMLDVGDDEPLQIVTGATNVFEGAYVPVAKAVATLPTGVIKKGKLRGVTSYGMLCSGQELNLSEADYEGAGVDGIMILKNEAPVGMDIRELLNLSGSVIEFEIGANRPDCLSILGIAREAAAATGKPLKIPEIKYTENKENIKDIVSINIEATDLCTRYMAAAVTNVKIQSSPDWIKNRLKQGGIRPINNIVDITNFVMLETGQPMHAFDLREIGGKKIVVRKAKEGEKLTTLDEKEHKLTKEMLLICDEQKPIGLAGIMGGLDSGIKEDTTTVVFESAKFMYGNIRQTSRALGISTESSMRFSKGLDASTTEFALKRALTLVDMLNAGEVAQGITDILNEDLTCKKITTTAQNVNKTLGTDLDENLICNLLNSVSIKTHTYKGNIECEIPLFRGDIYGQADIAEEVARMYGYDNIKPTDYKCELKRGGTHKGEEKEDIIKTYLSANGFNEIITYAFIGKQTFDKLGVSMPNSVKILNPLGDDTAYMRTTLIPHMLDTIALNYNRKNTDIDLFEVGRVHKPLEEGEESADGLPKEIPMLALSCSGSGDFYSLKDIINDITTLICGKTVDCTPVNMECLHPGISATLLIDGEEIGFLGALNPKLKMEIPIIVAQINLEKLFSIEKPAVKYKALPKYPSATRDIAIIVSEDKGAGIIEKAIKKAGGNKVVSVNLFDVYKSMQIGEGKKSLAYAINMRSESATLTDEEVEGVMQKILKALIKEFDAKLRD